MKTKNDTISAYVSCVKSTQTMVIKHACTAAWENHTSETQCLHEAGLSTGCEPVQGACDALFHGSMWTAPARGGGQGRVLKYKERPGQQLYLFRDDNSIE